ncbi:SPOR domain-containing protein [Albirhodobacter sp. R86504]|uniref:SPOR domain-containing protein n=1 Tax=Albirhodobacter sp. R86504 TaxID=3093848 RepID=UPI00366C87B9
MARQSVIRTVFLLGGVVALAACEEGQSLSFLTAPSTGEDASATAPASKTVERDVEAPEIFSETGPGLWDGRPSLGGVWVAHPDVKDPERVIIRNAGSDKFVVGALFRRERATPGPKIQVSSDAAEALGMLAGAPVELSVIALKREEAPAAQSLLVDAPVADAATAPASAIGAETIATAPLKPAGDIAASASAAIAKAETTSQTKPAAKPANTSAAKPAAPAPSQAAPSGSGPSKPFIQLGIFSVEANATRAQASLQKAGIGAKLVKEDWQGKTFWRVLGGPATSNADRDALLTKIKGMGFPDSYAVSK